MAKTPSTMIPLGTRAPNFHLLDVTTTGKFRSLDELKSEKATTIMFLCNHCPYVKHIQHKLVEVANYYQAKGVSFVAINSNDIETYPEDSPERMKAEAKKHQFPFPYLFDETQAIAKAYQAACTPDFFVFDKNLQCVYRGRFDDATPGNSQPVTGADLKNALDQILKNEAVDQDQKASIGCNIKWKKTNP